MQNLQFPLFQKKIIHKIGILDSGIGGLPVLKELLKLYPAHYYYLADTKNFPYGPKSPRELLSITYHNIDLLLSYKVECIILACHTLSALVLDDVKKKYPEIIFIDVIAPVIQKALITTKNKRIGVLATVATVKSNSYKNLLFNSDPEIEVIQQECPKLAYLIEKHYPRGIEIISKELLTNYLDNELLQSVDTLILGCTHYEWVKHKVGEFTSAAVICASQEVTFCFTKNNFAIFSNLIDSTVTFVSPMGAALQERFSHFFNTIRT